MKRITLNDGSQREFVNGHDRFSAYLGGLGSGKSFAGIARGLKFSQQPKPNGAYHGPRGAIVAASYPILKDVILPLFFEMMEGSGLWRTGNPEKDYAKGDKKAYLKNGAEILFRSLDRPNVMRGVELSWFFIDEGRLVSREAWNILIGRLRQPGYNHAGWVCSTPNGYDWMWELFHEESASKLSQATWYGATTYENRLHLPEEYVDSLEASYEGNFFEQEVLGKFIPRMQGAVFPHWKISEAVTTLPYDPSLPLYSFWDFGVGDLGVVLFAQIAWREKRLTSGGTESVPELRFIGEIAEKDWSIARWAEEFQKYCDEHFQGRRPTSSFGDPAGRQRSLVTGTSVLDELLAHGVSVAPAPKRPADYAIVILDNMMAGNRVMADKNMCSGLTKALASYHWPTDSDGNRTAAPSPVHDWSSHYCDAARYGAAALLSHFPKRRAREPEAPYLPGMMGHVVQQIIAPVEDWLGVDPNEERPIDWTPVLINPVAQ